MVTMIPRRVFRPAPIATKCQAITGPGAAVVPLAAGPAAELVPLVAGPVAAVDIEAAVDTAEAGPVEVVGRGPVAGGGGLNSIASP